MQKTVLLNYAKLLARMGLNVQKGQEVIISAELDQPEFAQPACAGGGGLPPGDEAGALPGGIVFPAGDQRPALPLFQAGVAGLFQGLGGGFHRVPGAGAAANEVKQQGRIVHRV